MSHFLFLLYLPPLNKWMIPAVLHSFMGTIILYIQNKYHNFHCVREHASPCTALNFLSVELQTSLDLKL